MKPSPTFQYLFIEVTTALLVLLLLYTGSTKLLDHSGFINGIHNNPLLAPYRFILGWIIPLTEVFIGILLILPRFRKTGLISASCLLLLLTIYIGYMLWRSSKLPCTCGGIIEKMTWKQHFWFNIMFTLLSFLSVLLYPKRLEISNRSSRTPVNIVGNLKQS